MQKEELQEEILRLKRERNAIILAHNYQRDEVQEIADYTGDSLELSRTAATIKCDVIVFCGVNFMAESASILSPEKTVLLPESGACCPMADMIKVKGPRVPREFPGYKIQPTFIYPIEYSLSDIKREHPGVPVVSYVNTTAEVKAHSDICCTSANVVKVIESIPGDVVISVPDRNLSAWAQKNTKKKVISWDGFCHVHDRVIKENVLKAREEHPGALVLAHPECRMEVLELADHVTSTSGMLRYVKSSPHTEFVVGTEVGIMYRMKKENPEKTFHALRRDMVCPNMKKTTLQSVLRALKENVTVIKVPEDIRVPANRALERMLAVV